MNPTPETRASLILRLQRPADAVAWGEFVEIYQPLIFRLATSRGLQEADALDLCQDVLTRVARAINQFNPDPQRGSFRGWISTITRNLVVEHLRSRQRRPLTADDSAIGQAILETASQEDGRWFEAERRRQVFAWAADKLRPSFQPRTWQAFWDTAVLQHRVDTVAQRLQMTTGAVYIARSRVMARLREKIQLQLEDAEASSSALEYPGEPS